MSVQDAVQFHRGDLFSRKSDSAQGFKAIEIDAYGKPHAGLDSRIALTVLVEALPAVAFKAVPVRFQSLARAAPDADAAGGHDGALGRQ